jgi:DNA-binding FadR family transcriptional regulator
MALRNRGGPSGLARVIGPAMAMAVRRATRKDLERLKEILEQRRP